MLNLYFVLAVQHSKNALYIFISRIEHRNGRICLLALFCHFMTVISSNISCSHQIRYLKLLMNRVALRLKDLRESFSF